MDIRCKKCGKLLARTDGNRVEIKNGKRKMNVYGIIEFICDRCGEMTLYVCKRN